jgi:hypothetical protein
MLTGLRVGWTFTPARFSRIKTFWPLESESTAFRAPNKTSLMQLCRLRYFLLRHHA